GEYTHDSSIAAAAVHAGLLQPGESGVVRVTVCPGRLYYQGSTQHGVTSRDWQNDGQYYLSLKIERAAAGQPQPAPTETIPIPLGLDVLPDPGNMTAHRQDLGKTFYFRVTGTTGAGSAFSEADVAAVWGTDVYTHDSSIAVAAVHAG